MNRGTIISLKPLPLMPTFSHSCDANPVFVKLLARQIRQFGIDLPCSAADGSYRVYTGDVSVSDKGEILVWQPSANGKE
jgi:formylmethanofuran dehydrogenase subunit C